MTARPVRREAALASVELAGRPVAYLLKRSAARRSLSLRVNRDGLAQVNAPWRLPLADIEAFLRRHGDWLAAQLDRRPAAFDPLAETALPYLGSSLPVHRHADPGLARIWRDADGLHYSVGVTAADLLAWYRDQARQVIGHRLAATCARLGLAVPPWRLSNARTRWGSLSVRGVVGLNWRLVKAEPAVLDYVICHELAHLRHRNHAPVFWREVERYCPDYRSARAALRSRGAEYLAF